MEEVLRYVVIFSVGDSTFETPIDIDASNDEYSASEILTIILQHCLKEVSDHIPNTVKDDISINNICKL